MRGERDIGEDGRLSIGERKSNTAELNFAKTGGLGNGMLRHSH